MKIYTSKNLVDWQLRFLKKYNITPDMHTTGVLGQHTLLIGEDSLRYYTSHENIQKWRGSLFHIHNSITLVTYGFEDFFKAPENSFLFVRDLLTLRYLEDQDTTTLDGLLPQYYPRHIFSKAAEAEHVMESLTTVDTVLAVDIETTMNGEIRCIGFAKAGMAWCIPLLNGRTNYWSKADELIVIKALAKMLTTVKIVWQNGLFDAQFLYRDFGIFPRHQTDIMLSHHAKYPHLRKSLDFQASFYCPYYQQWKLSEHDQEHQWTSTRDEDVWNYNCNDCHYTYAIWKAMGLQTPIQEKQNRLFVPTFFAVSTGIRIDTVKKQEISQQLSELSIVKLAQIHKIAGTPLNPKSPKQLSGFFYDTLRQKEVKIRATNSRTCNNEALRQIGDFEILLRPLIQLIQEYRSIEVFRSTFIHALLDEKSRFRYTYNIAGTKTFRFSSSRHIFGFGGNIQNIPKGTPMGKTFSFSLPNLRDLFIPDDGFTFFDMDLQRADLQIVAYESGEPELIKALQTGVDIHLLNACALQNIDIALEDLTDNSPQYQTLKQKHAKWRDLAKRFCHGTNYGGKPGTMAKNCNVTVKEAERLQRVYFGRFPRIHHWQKTKIAAVRTTRQLTNIFGYSHQFFEPVVNIVPEVLAWSPQSTVACLINHIWLNLWQDAPNIFVLIQVHDSLAGQFRTAQLSTCLAALYKAATVVLPYEIPLVIPVNIKTSTKSWGDC